MLSKLLDIQAPNDDPLTMRRSRALAMLLLLLVAITIPFALLDPFLTGNLQGLIINTVAILLFCGIYLINRSGRLPLAITLFLIGLSALPISASVFIKTPLPTIFFPVLLVVIAAAFGSSRAPLIWAAIATLIPFVINLALYQSLVPPAGPIVLPGGASAPTLLALEIVAITLYWMLAGVSWLSGRQLYLTIDESRAATQVAIAGQRSIAAQQLDLAGQNEQLQQVRQELESLVASLAVPVVPVADGVGLLPLVGAFDASRSAEVERKTLAFVSEQRMRALVIDLSGAAGLKASGVAALVRLCGALRLLGVTPVMAGLGVQGAMLLSNERVALPRTAATVQDALALLQQSD